MNTSIILKLLLMVLPRSFPFEINYNSDDIIDSNMLALSNSFTAVYKYLNNNFGLALMRYRQTNDSYTMFYDYVSPSLKGHIMEIDKSYHQKFNNSLKIYYLHRMTRHFVRNLFQVNTSILDIFNYSCERQQSQLSFKMLHKPNSSSVNNNSLEECAYKYSMEINSMFIIRIWQKHPYYAFFIIFNLTVSFTITLILIYILISIIFKKNFFGKKHGSTIDRSIAALYESDSYVIVPSDSCTLNQHIFLYTIFMISLLLILLLAYVGLLNNGYLSQYSLKIMVNVRFYLIQTFVYIIGMLGNYSSTLQRIAIDVEELSESIFKTNAKQSQAASLFFESNPTYMENKVRLENVFLSTQKITHDVIHDIYSLTKQMVAINLEANKVFKDRTHLFKNFSRWNNDYKRFILNFTQILASEEKIKLINSAISNYVLVSKEHVNQLLYDISQGPLNHQANLADLMYPFGSSSKFIMAAIKRIYLMHSTYDTALKNTFIKYFNPLQHVLGNGIILIYLSLVLVVVQGVVTMLFWCIKNTLSDLTLAMTVTLKAIIYVAQFFIITCFTFISWGALLGYIAIFPLEHYICSGSIMDTINYSGNVTPNFSIFYQADIFSGITFSHLLEECREDKSLWDALGYYEHFDLDKVYKRYLSYQLEVAKSNFDKITFDNKLLNNYNILTSNLKKFTLINKKLNAFLTEDIHNFIVQSESIHSSILKTNSPDFSNVTSSNLLGSYLKEWRVSKNKKYIIQIPWDTVYKELHQKVNETLIILDHFEDILPSLHKTMGQTLSKTMVRIKHDLIYEYKIGFYYFNKNFISELTSLQSDLTCHPIWDFVHTIRMDICSKLLTPLCTEGLLLLIISYVLPIFFVVNCVYLNTLPRYTLSSRTSLINELWKDYKEMRSEANLHHIKKRKNKKHSKFFSTGIVVSLVKRAKKLSG